MLTPKQQKWIDHLPNDDAISIKPFDKHSESIFLTVKKRVQMVLGKKAQILHCGASNLGISGQDEIDIYIPVSEDGFDETVAQLKVLLGPPASFYPLERARFVTSQNNKYVTVSIMNKSHEGWIDGVRFESYLKAHPQTLKEYEKLKEDSNGTSTRNYYQKKTAFINEVLNIE